MYCLHCKYKIIINYYNTKYLLNLLKISENILKNNNIDESKITFWFLWIVISQ